MVKEGEGTDGQNGVVVEKYFAKPNPFPQETTFHFELVNPGTLELKIYSKVGQLVHQTSAELLEPGVLEIPWDATGNSAGVYFYSARLNDKKMNGKIVKIGKQ